jgi:hypothetical protein
VSFGLAVCIMLIGASDFCLQCEGSVCHSVTRMSVVQGASGEGSVLKHSFGDGPLVHSDMIVSPNPIGYTFPGH